jgi:hypothetical protein
VLTDQADLNRDDARAVRVDLFEHDDFVVLETGVDELHHPLDLLLEAGQNLATFGRGFVIVVRPGNKTLPGHDSPG